MKRIADMPIFIIAVLLPLSAFFHVEMINLAQYPWFPNQEYWIDLFLYGKSVLLQIAAGMMLVILLAKKIKRKKLRIEKENLLFIVLAGLFLLSAIFSRYPKESFFGSIEQYESVGVLVSYLIVIVYCKQYVLEETNIRKLWTFFLIGLGVSCVLGLLQIVQCDLWDTELGRKILVPERFAQLRENLRFSQDADGFGRVYMALYNSTYAGIYIVMLLPLLFLTKGKFGKMLRIPAVLCLLATLSKTSWVSAIVILILGYCMLSKTENIKQVKKRWIVLGIFCMFVAGAAVYTISAEEGVTKGEKKLQKVVGEVENICIVYQGNTLYFSEFPKDDGVTYRIVDEEGNEPLLTWVPERGEIDSLDPRFENLHFKVYQKDGIGYAVFRYEDVVFRFTDQLGTGKYEYVSVNGKPDELTEAATFLDKGDYLLNGRGYIWNRVIPLLAKSPVLGTGPDTFLQVFPQDDYVARANLGHGFFSEILTNAHSLYLQIALQNGLLAIGVIIILICIYIRSGWKFYKQKTVYTEQEKIGLACFLGSAGYLICGLTFASSVCTPPIFAVLAGSSWGIVRKLYW